MDAPSLPAPHPRRRLSLLTGPWHTSSRVVAVLVLLFLVFCNVPGQITRTLRLRDTNIFSLYPLEDQLEHGWPLTYLVREPTYESAGIVSFRSCWEPWLKVHEFGVWRLLTNLAAIIAVSLGVGTAFEFWRQGRNRVWQFHLRDFAALLTVACLLVAWYGAMRRGRAQEEAVLARNEGPNSAFGESPRPYIHGAPSDHAGVTWLRLLVGDGPFAPLDRVEELSVNSPGLAASGGLSCVQRLRVLSNSTSNDLRHLTSFPKLQALEISGPLRMSGQETDVSAADAVSSIDVPRMSRLRILTINQCEYRLVGLGRLQSLERIGLAECHVDEPTLRELSTLPRLRRIVLWYGYLEPAGLAHLQALKPLEDLEIAMAQVGDEGMRHVGSLAQLKTLDLSHCQIAPGSLRHLSGMTSLHSLGLAGDAIDNEAVEQLHLPPNVRDLSIWNTGVTANAIPLISRWTQLRTLLVPEETFSIEDLASLSTALPNCRVSRVKAPVLIE